MPNNDWITGYLQKKSQENPLDPITGGLQRLLSYPKKVVDTAANYYSGMKDQALNPTKQPIPIGDLAAEAMEPGSTTTLSSGEAASPFVSLLSNALDIGSDPSSYSATNPMAAILGHGKVPLAGILNEEGENVAFHGTPYNFDKFSNEAVRGKIGEGNQVVAPGLYTAENPAISEQFRKGVSRSKPDNFYAQQLIDQYGGDRAAAIEHIQSLSPGRMSTIEKNNPGVDLSNVLEHLQNGTERGVLYGVKLPHPDKFIDTSGTLGDLPPHIADAFPESDMARRYEDNYTKAMHDVEAALPYLKNTPGVRPYPEITNIEDALNTFKSGKYLNANKSKLGRSHGSIELEDGSPALSQYESEVAPISMEMTSINNPTVRKALGIGDPVYNNIISNLGKNVLESYAGPTSDMPLSSIIREDTPPDVIENLVNKGVAGVKYPDNLTRSGKSQTHNYVVFNPEKDAQIMGKLPSPNQEQISDFLRNIMKIRPY